MHALELVLCLGEWLPLFVECSYTASVNATDTFNPMYVLIL